MFNVSVTWIGLIGLISPQKQTKQDSDINPTLTVPRREILNVPEGRPFGRGHSVAFRVQVASHFHGVAGLPLLNVFVHGGLQQVGILPLRLSDSQYTFVSVLDEHRRVRTPHIRPHLLKNRDL